MAAGSLRWWLRKNPQPARLRIRLPDGEERSIALSGDKDKWRIAEEAIAASGAILVECIDTDGGIIRGRRIEAADDDELGAGESLDARAKEKAIVQDRREQSALVGQFRVAMIESFERGTQAAGQSQKELVALVNVLAHSLTNALTSLHATSMQLAQVLADSGTNDGDRNPQAMAFLAMMAGKLGMPIPAADASNGKSQVSEGP